ncbi:MAG: hypothetical protein R6W96_04680 [Clostridia bacterium]
MRNRDIETLRKLAMQVREIAMDPVMEERRLLWESHHAFEKNRPPLYIRDGGWSQETILPECVCEDDFFREIEFYLRKMIFQFELGDDYVIEPWVSIRAEYLLPEKGAWGVMHGIMDTGFYHGARKYTAPITDLDNLGELVVPKHRIDLEKTKLKHERLSDAIGDILTVDLDRSPHWWNWEADISTRLGYLRGLEQIMWDIHDNPEGFHRLLSFMSKGILKAQQEAEDAGDIGLTSGNNQSMPYARDLPRPKPHTPCKRKDLWCFSAAQEFNLVSPADHETFMLDYQKPIIEAFGASSYGCCEDLSNKMGMLRRMKNLRRIAVSPFSPVAKMAGEIGTEYIASYRPDPARTVCVSFDKEQTIRILQEAKHAFEANGCLYDICLKDVHTVGNDKGRLKAFVETVKSVVGG